MSINCKFFKFMQIVELGLHESETIEYFCNSVSLLDILKNFSLVLVLSINMKSIIVSCLEILDHIGVTQTCNNKRVDCLKN